MHASPRVRPASSTAIPQTHMLMGYSKNQKAAKDLLRWIHSKPVYDQWFVSQQGFTGGPTKDWEEHEVWDVDPVLKPFRDSRRSVGWRAMRGRPTAKRPR